MSRVINTDNPGKRRNHLMRTGAELLRRLSQKHDIDDEAKDMLALLIFSLQEIADGIEQSTLAWEKRNYWLKVEEFRSNWNWTGQLARQLENMVLNEEWQDLPTVMVKLFPHYSDITVSKFTRESSLWKGCYIALLDRHPA